MRTQHHTWYAYILLLTWHAYIETQGCTGAHPTTPQAHKRPHLVVKGPDEEVVGAWCCVCVRVCVCVCVCVCVSVYLYIYIYIYKARTY